MRMVGLQGRRRKGGERETNARMEKGAGGKKRPRLLTLCSYCGIKFRDNFNMKTHAGG